jgi:hypothetical protein
MISQPGRFSLEALAPLVIYLALHSPLLALYSFVALNVSVRSQADTAS